MNNNMQQKNVNVQSNPSSKVVGVKKDKKDENKLKRFKYKATDPAGTKIESFFDAENQTDVVAFLSNKGYNIISIEEDKLSNNLGLAALSYNKRMNSKDLNFFLTQLST